MAGKDISLLEGRNFLPKPYSIGKLAQFVRECLDTTAKPNELNGKPRELVTEVAGASREQTLGITQINSAVDQMDMRARLENYHDESGDAVRRATENGNDALVVLNNSVE